VKIQQCLALGALAIACGAALADQAPDSNGSPTRAKVRQSVIAARDAGRLVPAGDAADYAPPQAASPATLTRGEVRHEVLEARAAGELIPAGEAYDASFDRSAPTTFSGLTRAEVKTATLRARDAGELIPAGEYEMAALARDRAQATYARLARLAHKPARMVASGN
jgi:hypothetical protein